MLSERHFELLLKIFAVIMLASLPYACMQGLDRQAEADYQQCLSWQEDGYDIRCSRSEYHKK